MTEAGDCEHNHWFFKTPRLAWTQTLESVAAFLRLDHDLGSVQDALWEEIRDYD